MPPLNYLRAFEAAARHLSFKHAANELGVTRGAVAQQVKKLEAACGEKLFDRHRNTLTLTRKGEQYLPDISAAFRTISQATERFAPALRGRVFQLGIAPAFPQADSEFAELARCAAPGLKVRVQVTDDVALLREGRVDALLRVGRGPYPLFHVEHLTFAETFCGVAAGTLVTQPGLAGCREHKAIVGLLRAPRGSETPRSKAPE